MILVRKLSDKMQAICKQKIARFSSIKPSKNVSKCEQTEKLYISYYILWYHCTDIFFEIVEKLLTKYQYGDIIVL